MPFDFEQKMEASPQASATVNGKHIHSEYPKRFESGG
jgi:hypothetical protein